MFPYQALSQPLIGAAQQPIGRRDDLHVLVIAPAQLGLAPRGHLAAVIDGRRESQIRPPSPPGARRSAGQPSGSGHHRRTGGCSACPLKAPLLRPGRAPARRRRSPAGRFPARGVGRWRAHGSTTSATRSGRPPHGVAILLVLRPAGGRDRRVRCVDGRQRRGRAVPGQLLVPPRAHTPSITVGTDTLRRQMCSLLRRQRHHLADSAACR